MANPSFIPRTRFSPGGTERFSHKMSEGFAARVMRTFGVVAQGVIPGRCVKHMEIHDDHLSDIHLHGH